MMCLVIEEASELREELLVMEGGALRSDPSEAGLL
jgi:hypothetical protein